MKLPFLPTGSCLLIGTAALLAVSSGSAQAASVSSLRPSDLREYNSQPARVKKAIESALSLTRRNLRYSFGSNNPRTGGLDCSGTMQAIFQPQGISVPRQANQQYSWVQKSGRLRQLSGVYSVQDRRLAGIKPGDLLFWEGTYNVGNRYPRTSHVMMFLGHRKKDGKPVMIGASNGRAYDGRSRYGVSVFDFSVPSKSSRAKFVGYGSVPGIRVGGGSSSTFRIAKRVSTSSSKTKLTASTDANRKRGGIFSRIFRKRRS